MEQPLVTVVTVTYNSADYVRDAIESILASSYTNFELIIGDDCSTDSTWEIIQEYKDPRIVAYRNEQNLKEYPNRNKAISLAKGEYLLFIDGDDMIYPHGLEFMVRMLDAFPTCGMAIRSGFRNNLFYPVIITPTQFYREQYFGTGFMGTALTNVFFRTNVLIEVGGFSLESKIGDEFIRYKIAARYDSLLINDDLTWWRETPGQASRAIAKDGITILESYKLFFQFIDHRDCPLPQIERNRARHNLYIKLSRVIIKKICSLSFKKASSLIKWFRVPIFYLIFIRKPIVEDVFVEFSVEKPLRLPFSEHPFASPLKYVKNQNYDLL